MSEIFQLLDPDLDEAIAQFDSGMVLTDTRLFAIVECALRECRDSRAILRASSDPDILRVKEWRNDSTRLSWIEQNLVGTVQPGTQGLMKAWVIATQRDKPIRETIDLLIGGSLEQPDPHAQKH